APGLDAFPAMRYRFALLVRRRLRLAIPLVLLALGLSADASKPRLRLERIDGSSFASDGTVRLFASVVELEGNIDDSRAPQAFVLKMDGKSLGHPDKAQPFQGAGEPLDLVVVIESSSLYGPKKIVVPPPAPPARTGKRGKKSKTAASADDDDDDKAALLKGNKIARDVLKQVVAVGDEPLDKVKDAVRALFENLSPQVRVLLIDYGADMTPHSPFRPAAALDGELDDLSPDGEAGDLALSHAVDAALVQLNKPRDATAVGGKTPRRLIVVISDGLNSQMDRKTFKMLGDAAAHARVPIHTIAFSPTDERGPLLNLGEVSKRSNGTFRWAKSADDLRAQIDTLSDELNKQYVLTYKVDARSLEGRTFQLSCDELTSNALVYDSSGGAFGYAPATRPLLPWWLWAVAGVLLFGGAAAMVVARRPKKQMKFSPYKNAVVSHQPSAVATGSVQKPVQAAPVVRAPVRGVLIVVSGALAGRRVDVGAQPITIGKGAATLQIGDDPALSTRHAELALRGGAFVVTDLGSTNGTFVNSQRIAQPTRLADGDLLRFGNTQMKFRTE
ncbi:MAG: FHA domain-containing protein, partial [Myxococcales bacterium]|nr:FHA domain-containing protein [Myxococcales bacterium]